MKLKTILLLLLFFQLGSCTKRYGYLKKVRVTCDSKKNPTKDEKKTKDTPELFLFETASIDSNISPAPNAPLTILSEHPHPPKQYLSPQSVPKNQNIQKQQKNHLKKNYTEPTEHKLNKYARWALLLSLLALTSVGLLWVLPFVGVLAIFLFGVFAQDYGGRALKQLKTSPEKGKWMALVGIILGSLILSAAIAFMMVFLLNFNTSATNTTILIEFIVAALGVFALFMYSRFHVPKPKRSKPLKPIKPKIVPGPDNWNSNAVMALVFATVTILSVGIVAITMISFFALLALIGTVFALILGILGLLEIKSTHQKGKVFAFIGVFLVPIIFLLLIPPLAILALLIGGTWWLIKRHKRKKANKASLS